MKLTTNALDILIALVIVAITVLIIAKGISSIPADFNYALLALIAGRLGITVPAPPTTP
jgi:hypothetical protein